MAKKRYSYRYRHHGRRRRSSGTARAIKKVWYSWPARFSRRLAGAAVTGTVMNGVRTAWWLANKMARHY